MYNKQTKNRNRKCAGKRRELASGCCGGALTIASSIVGEWRRTSVNSRRRLHAYHKRSAEKVLHTVRSYKWQLTNFLRQSVSDDEYAMRTAYEKSKREQAWKKLSVLVDTYFFCLFAVVMPSTTILVTCKLLFF